MHLQISFGWHQFFFYLHPQFFFGGHPNILRLAPINFHRMALRCFFCWHTHFFPAAPTFSIAGAQIFLCTQNLSCWHQNFLSQDPRFSPPSSPSPAPNQAMAAGQHPSSASGIRLHQTLLTVPSSTPQLVMEQAAIGSFATHQLLKITSHEQMVHALPGISFAAS